MAEPAQAVANKEATKPPMPLPASSPLTTTQSLTLQLPSEPLVVKVDSGVPDWVSPAIQILVALGSVMVILYQLGRQNKDAVAQHRSTVKSELQLEAYREFQTLHAKLIESEVLQGRVHRIGMQLHSTLLAQKNGWPPGPFSETEPKFRDELYQYMDRAGDLVTFIERYESLLPGFDVFKLAIGSASQDIRDAYNESFQSFLLEWLPMADPESGKFVRVPMVTEAALSSLGDIAKPIERGLGLLQCWTMDLSVEIQNHFLGRYADQNVSHREPIDPEYFVVTAAPGQRTQLHKHFNEETNFGMRAAAAKKFVLDNR